MDSAPSDSQHWFAHSADDLSALQDQILTILKDYYLQPDRPITSGLKKNSLFKRLYRAEPPQDGVGFPAALEHFQSEILPFSVRTWHPLFLNQMFPGASYPAVVGDLLASMLNPTLATFEVSPAATLIERNVSAWMAQLLGLPAGSGGIFLPGSSLANLLALTVARNRFLSPETGRRGLPANTQGVIICSEASHYSVANAANLLGIGTDHIVLVKTNSRAEMDVADFRQQLIRCDQSGWTPFAVVLTAGVTVTGGIDPLEEIISICRDRPVHIHVDAAFGGGLALTSRGQHYLRGLASAHSVCWDAHKWFHAPLTSTVLLVPDLQALRSTFSSDADYLFHPQEEMHDQLDDLGHYTILCGKRFDALKIWLLWLGYGTEYFRQLAESRLALTQAFYELLLVAPDFTPAYEPVTPIVCFRYQPPEFGGLQTAYADRMHRAIRETIKHAGIAFFNYSSLNGSIAFRTVLVNPLTTLSHLQNLITAIREAGQRFLHANPPRNC